MKKLYIEETEDTPKVDFDIENCVFEIVGRSLPEDATTFYKPVIEWINAEVETAECELELHLKLEYFNSSSAKQILQILLLFEKFYLKGVKIKGKWFYSEADELMEARGREINSLVGLPFEVVKF
jgi:hypothetical protein